MKWVALFFLLVGQLLDGVETPHSALKRLQDGNKRFVNEMLLHPRRMHDKRMSLTKEQSPYGVMITCSDSRVIPEIIFDEGLGDLFVVRVAGNIIGSTELESVMYAIDHLHPAIVVVMGHENCGAVKAVVAKNAHDIPTIAALIHPSVEKAKRKDPKNPLKPSIELNALNMRSLLLQAKGIEEKVKAKSLAVHAAYYNLQTGHVDFLDD